mgnify:CR=1 FL=1
MIRNRPSTPKEKEAWDFAKELHKDQVRKFINKPYQIATRGSNVPPSERITPANSPINFYAKFADVADWAKDYVRILNLRKKLTYIR